MKNPVKNPVKKNCKKNPVKCKSILGAKSKSPEVYESCISEKNVNPVKNKFDLLCEYKNRINNKWKYQWKYQWKSQ